MVRTVITATTAAPVPITVTVLAERTTPVEAIRRRGAAEPATPATVLEEMSIPAAAVTTPPPARATITARARPQQEARWPTAPLPPDSTTPAAPRQVDSIGARVTLDTTIGPRARRAIAAGAACMPAASADSTAGAERLRSGGISYVTSDEQLFKRFVTRIGCVDGVLRQAGEGGREESRRAEDVRFAR